LCGVKFVDKCKLGIAKSQPLALKIAQFSLLYRFHGSQKTVV